MCEALRITDPPLSRSILWLLLFNITSISERLNVLFNLHREKLDFYYSRKFFENKNQNHCLSWKAPLMQLKILHKITTFSLLSYVMNFHLTYHFLQW